MTFATQEPAANDQAALVLVVGLISALTLKETFNKEDLERLSFVAGK